jgi:plasmid maintenance system antidote protein VapI
MQTKKLPLWMNLQSRFELEKAEDLLEDILKNEVHRYKMA